MITRRLLLLPLILIYFITCNKTNETGVVKEKGFLIFDGNDDLVFYPVAILDSNDCRLGLVSENLQPGVALPLHLLSDETFSYLERAMDTLNLSKSMEYFGNFILITAAEIEYEALNKHISVDSQLKINFQLGIQGKLVEFSYNQFPLKINNINPLFCLDKKKTDIQECNCGLFLNSQSDSYLHKICQYIKAKDKYSNLPAQYSVKATTKDTFNKKEVIKVELSCCNLGDVAYFDINTKEIITMKFGAK